ISVTATDYPIGPGRTQMIGPSAVGTHGGSQTTFQNDDGTAIDSTSLGRIQDLLKGYLAVEKGTDRTSVGDGKSIEQHGPYNTANYVEFYLGNLDGTQYQLGSLGPAEVCHGATAMIQEYDRNISVNVYSVAFVTDTGTITTWINIQGVFTDDEVDDGRFFMIRPSGGWNQTHLNNFKFQFGTHANYSGGSTSWLGIP